MTEYDSYVFNSLFICSKILHIYFKGFIYSTMLVAWLGATGLVLVMGPSELLDFIFHGKK